MKYVKISLVFFSFSCISTWAIAQNKILADAKTVAHLKQFRSDYENSMLKNKADRLVLYYGDSIRLMPEFQKTITGKNNTVAYHKAFTARFDIKSYVRKEAEIIDLGKFILEVGFFTMTVKLKSTAKDYDVEGKYQNVWKKWANGDLSLVVDAWNYNHSLPIEDQFRFDEIVETDVSRLAHAPVNSPISFELAALNRLMEVTITQHDPIIWSQFYATDGMFMYSRSPTYEGKKRLEEFISRHVKDLPVFEKLDVRNDKIELSGNYVIEYASHIAIIRQGDFSGVFTGKDLRIWRREKEGYLKIFRHIGMYD